MGKTYSTKMFFSIYTSSLQTQMTPYAENIPATLSKMYTVRTNDDVHASLEYLFIYFYLLFSVHYWNSLAN